jgi:hypothetical protein
MKWPELDELIDFALTIKNSSKSGKNCTLYEIRYNIRQRYGVGVRAIVLEQRQISAKKDFPCLSFYLIYCDIFTVLLSLDA